MFSRGGVLLNFLFDKKESKESASALHRERKKEKGEGGRKAIDLTTVKNKPE